MAHESFEDEAVARVLNAYFVPIKVDREERPGVDRICMSAVQAMTGSGGWPMSVFLTPEGRPFYGGTYFPPTARHGLPGFVDLLLAVRDAWQQRRPELVAGGARVTQVIAEQASFATTTDERALDGATLGTAFEALRQGFDATHGGWGQAPKFPQPMALEFLLRHYHATGKGHTLEMVERTLEAMARGGVLDQIGA